MKHILWKIDVVKSAKKKVIALGNVEICRTKFVDF